MSTRTPRHREAGGFTPNTVNLYHYKGDGSLAATYTGSLGTGTFETMDDVVTKPYQPGITIVNNGMKRSSVTKGCSAMSGSQSYLPYGASGVTFITGQQFIDWESEFGTLSSKCSNKDYSSLLNLACTQALAGVRKPEVAGLVALKELKETVHSLTHPIDGILSFLRRNVTRSYKKRHTVNNWFGKTAKDVADQHLTVVFGILPFVQDMQGILKALREFDPTPQRFSSRGSSSSIDTKSDDRTYTNYEDSSSKSQVTVQSEVTRTVTVRAYQLYEASVSITDSLGLTPSDVPTAAWQTLPMSFVVDWFINVQEFIHALTPVAGVTYLTSGYTVTEVDACHCTYKMVVTRKSPTSGWAGNWDGGTQQRVSLAKRRVPASLLNHIGIEVKKRMDRDVLDTFKITAGLSLIIQRLRVL